MIKKYEPVHEQLWFNLTGTDKLSDQINQASQTFLSDKHSTTGVDLFVVKEGFESGFKVAEYKPEDIQYYQTIPQQYQRTLEEASRSVLRSKLEKFSTNKFDPIFTRAFMDCFQNKGERLYNVTFFVQLNPEFVSRSEFKKCIKNYPTYDVSGIDSVNHSVQTENILLLTLRLPYKNHTGNDSSYNINITRTLWNNVLRNRQMES